MVAAAVDEGADGHGSDVGREGGVRAEVDGASNERGDGGEDGRGGRRARGELGGAGPGVEDGVGADTECGVEEAAAGAGGAEDSTDEAQS